MREELVLAAKGELPADLLVQNGTLVNVDTGEIYPGGVAIKGERIAAIGDVDYTIGPETQILDAMGHYLCPGFIDTHMHLDGSQLSVTEFARAVVPRGTTAISTDFYEYGIVAGTKAIRFALDEMKQTPLKVLFTLPLHHYLSHGPFGSTHTIQADDMYEMLDWSECVGLSEWNVNKWEIPDNLIKPITDAARDRGKLIAGHFGIMPSELVHATAALGIYSEHEASGPQEALEKARAGVHIQMREGSAGRDLTQVIKAVTELKADPRHFSFSTDEQEADSLVHDGHIDHKVRMAVACGVPPVTAVQMASLNAAEYFGVAGDLGSIAPGKIADLVMVNDLTEFRVTTVIANGKVVGQDGHYVGDLRPPKYPDYFFNTIKLNHATTQDDFVISAPRNTGRAKTRVIGVVRGSLVTEHRQLSLPVEGRRLVADVDQDVIKVAVLDRHEASGRMGKGFVQGLGIASGAVGSTFNPELMNVVVAGTNDRDMSLVTNRIAELEGGYVVAHNGQIVGELPLPLLGLFANRPVEQVVDQLGNINRALRDLLGTDFPGLITALAFICLPVAIPSLKICEQGLVDVTTMELVDISV
jgi:adenine deaminase